MGSNYPNRNRRKANNMAIGRRTTVSGREETAAPVVAKCGIGDFTAGGFMQPGRYICTDVHTAFYDYNGKGKKTTSVHINFRPCDEAGNIAQGADEHHQYYSAGDPGRVVPVDDDGKPVDKGTKFGLINGASGLGGGSNYAFFLEKAVAAGLPEDYVQDTPCVLEGVVLQLVEVAQPKRESLQATGATGNAAPARQATTFVPSVIEVIPGEEEEEKPKAKKGPAKPAAAAAKPKGKPAPVQEEEEFDPEQALVEALKVYLDGKTTAMLLPARIQVFGILKKDMGLDQEQVDAVAELYNDTDTLGAYLEQIGFAISGDKKKIVKAG